MSWTARLIRLIDRIDRTRAGRIAALVIFLPITLSGMVPLIYLLQPKDRVGQITLPVERAKVAHHVGSTGGTPGGPQLTLHTTTRNGAPVTKRRPHNSPSQRAAK